MRALVYTAPGSLEMQDLPDPNLESGEVLIQVAACGICGSDVHGFLGRSRIRIPPMVMGHECIGRVVRVGATVRGVELGQRVVIQPVIGCGQCPVCRRGRSNICEHRELVGGHRPGGFAGLVSVPEAAVYPIPETVSDVAGTLIEPMGNAVHLIGLSGIGAYGTVAILGAGTLGLLTAVFARVAGARQVIVTDMDPNRLQIAAQLGATATLSASDGDIIERVTTLCPGGVDAVIDAAGFTSARRQAIALVQRGGTVVLLGTAEPESQLPMQDIINREIVLRGAYSSTDQEFRCAIDFIANEGVEMESWVQALSLESGVEMFQRLARDPQGLVKVVLQPDATPPA